MVDHSDAQITRYLWQSLRFTGNAFIKDEGSSARKRFQEEKRSDSDYEYILWGDSIEDGVVFTQAPLYEIWFNCPDAGLELILQYRSWSDFDMGVARALQALEKIGYGT